jgi:hypothetical protein
MFQFLMDTQDHLLDSGSVEVVVEVDPPIRIRVINMVVVVLENLEALQVVVETDKDRMLELLMVLQHMEEPLIVLVLIVVLAAVAVAAVLAVPVL